MYMKSFKVYSVPVKVNKELYNVNFREYGYSERGACRLISSGQEGFSKSRLCNDTKVLKLYTRGGNNVKKSVSTIRVSMNAPSRLAVFAVCGDSSIRYDEVKLPKNCSDINKVTEFLML